MPGKKKRAVRKEVRHALKQRGWRRTKTSGYARHVSEAGSSAARGRFTKAPAFRNPRKVKGKSTTLKNMAYIVVQKLPNGVVKITGRKMGNPVRRSGRKPRGRTARRKR